MAQCCNPHWLIAKGSVISTVLSRSSKEPQSYTHHAALYNTVGDTGKNGGLGLIALVIGGCPNGVAPSNR